MTNNELIQTLYNDIQDMKQEIQCVKQDMQRIDNSMQNMEQTVSALQHEVKKINLVLENEANRNIQIIAETNLDLSRRLAECTINANEVKANQLIHDIYINRHEARLNTLL